MRSDQTRPGGYYIGTDGKPHDAHGKPIIEVALLPDDFPAREALINAGIDTIEKVAAVSDEELLAVDTIGKVTLAKIRGYDDDFYSQQ